MNLFNIALLSSTVIDNGGNLQIELAYMDRRFSAGNPDEVAGTLYAQLTKEQAARFDSIVERAVCYERMAEWVEDRMAWSTPSELFKAVCTACFGRNRTPYWMRPTLDCKEAVIAILRCHPTAERYVLIERVKNSAYLIAHRRRRSKNENHNQYPTHAQNPQN